MKNGYQPKERNKIKPYPPKSGSDAIKSVNALNSYNKKQNSRERGEFMIKQKTHFIVKPIWKEVSKKEFINFLNNYPRQLKHDFSWYGHTYNDFEFANEWPDSVVARYYDEYNDESFYIMENYEEVYSNKTICEVEEDEKTSMEKPKGKIKIGIKSIESINLISKTTGEKITLTIGD